MAFPFKENSGASKKALKDGFTTDKQPDESEIYPMWEDEYIGGKPEKPFKGGFLGRNEGWER
jgi:hypothetical protein